MAAEQKGATEIKPRKGWLMFRKRGALRGLEDDKMTTPINKVYAADLFKAYGHQLEILRTVRKGSGFSIYLPLAVSQALGLNKDDHLICFIDSESSFTYLIITKDSTLAEQLRPLILEKREKAEALHRKMREQLQTQQQTTEAKQDAIEVDV